MAVLVTKNKWSVQVRWAIASVYHRSRHDHLPRVHLLSRQFSAGKGQLVYGTKRANVIISDDKPSTYPVNLTKPSPIPAGEALKLSGGFA